MCRAVGFGWAGGRLFTPAGALLAHHVDLWQSLRAWGSWRFLLTVLRGRYELLWIAAGSDTLASPAWAAGSLYGDSAWAGIFATKRRCPITRG